MPRKSPINKKHKQGTRSPKHPIRPYYWTYTDQELESILALAEMQVNATYANYRASSKVLRSIPEWRDYKRKSRKYYYHRGRYLKLLDEMMKRKV